MDANTLDIVGDFAIAAAGVALAVVTAILANSYRRRMRLELAEARLEAYGRLYEITGLAAPIRLDLRGDKGSLTPSEREELYRELTTWYYRDGNGMLLEGDTRDVYLTAKHNLLCYDDRFRPATAWSSIQEDMPPGQGTEDLETLRGVISIRQLSLLRTQLKRDLAIFGSPYKDTLAKHEQEFLVECGVDLDKPPWKGATRRTARLENTQREGEASQEILPDIRSYDQLA